MRIERLVIGLVLLVMQPTLASTETVSDEPIAVKSATPDLNPEAVILNNDGVAALKQTRSNKSKTGYKSNLTPRFWEAMFDKFTAALELEPTFRIARQNLGIAHNNYALYLGHQRKLTEAIKHFHQALYIDEENKTTEGNLNWYLRNAFGKDPENFDVRVKLADDARSNNDLVDALVEYRIALKLKDDPSIKKKLDDVDRELNHKGYPASERENVGWTGDFCFPSKIK